MEVKGKVLRLLEDQLLLPVPEEGKKRPNPGAAERPRKDSLGLGVRDRHHPPAHPPNPTPPQGFSFGRFQPLSY